VSTMNEYKQQTLTHQQEMLVIPFLGVDLKFF
jgi:hypothetical protein